MAFFDEGIGPMAAHAGLAGAYLPHAATDASGDVGAVHHDMSLDAPAISWTGLLFFCGAQVSRPTSNRNLRSESECSLHSPCFRACRSSGLHDRISALVARENAVHGCPLLCG